jgi:Mg2+ and Co2+ transporter CorA
VPFLALDEIVGAFEPEVLRLDEQLDAIQVDLLGTAPARVHGELIGIRRTLSEAFQALGWYAGDLSHVAGGPAELLGAKAAAEPLLGNHHKHVALLRDAAKDYRDEAQDALGQVATDAASQQGQAINVLTVVAAVFLPLTVITGISG